MLPAFLATLLFSISAVSATRSSRQIGPQTANFWRLLVATSLLALWSHTLGQGLAGDGLWVFLISGLVGFGLGDMALFETLNRLGSRLSILMVHCLAAPIAALVEWLWLGTTLSAGQMAAGATILLGVALALLPRRGTFTPKPGAAAGIFFGLIAAAGQAMGAVLSRKAYVMNSAQGLDLDGMTAAYQRILGGIVLVALCHVFRAGSMRPSLSAGRAPMVWPWIIVNALAGPTFGVGCYQWALESAGTGIVLPIVAATPLVVIPFARWLEGDQPSARSLMGGLIAVIGAVLLAWITEREDAG